MTLKRLVNSAWFYGLLGLSGLAGPTALAQGWYDTDWTYRKKITIDNTKVSTVGSTDLTNFPVLISRTDADWRDAANDGNVEQSDGGDIVFTAANGTTKLDHEIESYDSTSGALVAWVEVPTVSAATDTDIYIYYGNDSGVADQWNIEGTWNTNYVMVHHLDESPNDGVAGHLDSTSNNRDGTPQNFQDGGGGSTAAGGQISGSDDFAGDDDYVDLGTGCAVTTPWTLEAWVYPSSPLAYDRVFTQGDGACAGTQLMVYSHSGKLNIVTQASGGEPIAATAALPDSTWTHFVWSYNGSTHTLYLDGASSSSATTGNGVGIDGNIALGRRAAGNYWHGNLDEIRLSNTARSADWVVTSFNNQDSPSTFVSVAAEEALGPSVGPSAAGACKGSDCDYHTIQDAIDAAAPGDIITVHFNDDSQYSPPRTDNDCYNEHITINVANLTLQGDSTTPISAACIAPSSGGNIVTITASGVTLRNLEISGRSNNGAGGQNANGAGGRSGGYGILISGDDVDDVVIDNVTVSYSRLDNIRWDGDQDNDNNGNATIRNCYLHHSDLPGHNIRIIGGSSASEAHLIENNLITTGQGVQADSEYITVRHNIVNGWPYWGHMAASASYPETHDYNGQQNNYGGGWRYFSRCPAGIYVQNGGAGTDINITHNIVVGTRVGIRVQTTGTLSNNTVVNPFNPGNNFTDADAVRNGTVGIMLVSGFSGTVQNNIVVVTDDNRANGLPASHGSTRYTSGITGHGIAFSGGSGTLGAGASIRNNDVWGFVDTDGNTSTNWGSGLADCGRNSDAKCSDNISRDPVFADDTSDESNGGSGPCDADADDSRCYELYHDNYFLKTDRTGGGCHADIRLNTAGYIGFVDLASSNDFAGLGDCDPASDAGTPSSLIDFGNGAVSGEPGNSGGLPNLGAFGNTNRASQSPSLRIVEIDVGDGGVKDGSTTAKIPGLIQPRSGGIQEVNVYFNRAVTANSSSFEIYTHCGGQRLTAPTFDFTGASTAPFKIKMTWPSGTFEDRWIRIHALADDAANKIVDYQAEALDGEISDLQDGTLPSGDGTIGGDAEFLVGSVVGDIDGDRTVEGDSGEHDYDAVTGYSAYPAGSCSTCAEDADGDGDVDTDDLAVVTGNDTDALNDAAAGSMWFEPNWNYRKKITIDHTKVSTVATGDLTDFPVLISTTDANWRHTSGGGHVGLLDGGDIAFTGCDGATQLDHEIEYYDPASGQLLAWVELGNIYASENTDFYIYYGNAAAADQQDTAGTWSNNYQAVWHLDEFPGDSLEFDTDQGKAPAMVQVSGDIYAIAYQGAGDDGWLATVDINADGSIENAVIDTLEFDTTQGKAPAIVQVSGDIYAIAYQGAGDDGWLATVDINADGSIENAVIGTLEFDTTQGKTPEILQVSGDIFAIAYWGDSDDGWLKTIDINTDGTIAGEVAALEFDTTKGEVPAMVHVSGDIYAIAYQGDGDDGWLKTIDINTDGTIDGEVAALEFDTTQGKAPAMVQVSGDIYAIAYQGDGDDGWLKTIDINTSGTIDGEVAALEFDTTKALAPVITPLLSDLYGIAYEDTNGFGVIQTVDVNGNGTIDGTRALLTFDGLMGITPAIDAVSASYCAIVYEGDGSDGFLQTLRLDAAGIIKPFHDATTGANTGVAEASSATGQFNNALAFNGATSYGSVTAAAGIDALGKTAMTVEAWAYALSDGEGGKAKIVDKSDHRDPNQGNGYTLLVTAEAGGAVKVHASVEHDGATNALAYSSSTMTVGAWHHVAFTYNEDSDGRVKVYIDGALATLGTDTAGAGAVSDDSAIDLLIGNAIDNGRTFDGVIEEVRISDSARSADWMITGYNNQSAPGTFYGIGVEETP